MVAAIPAALSVASTAAGLFGGGGGGGQAPGIPKFLRRAQSGAINDFNNLSHQLQPQYLDWASQMAPQIQQQLGAYQNNPYAQGAQNLAQGVSDYGTGQLAPMQAYGANQLTGLGDMAANNAGSTLGVLNSAPSILSGLPAAQAYLGGAYGPAVNQLQSNITGGQIPSFLNTASGAQGGLANFLQSPAFQQAMQNSGGQTAGSFLNAAGGPANSFAQSLNSGQQNSLLNQVNPAASSFLQNAQQGSQGFDPQTNLYNHLYQQTIDHQNAINSMAGVGTSPYGAGLTGDAGRKFDSDWLNQSLQRQNVAGQNALQNVAGYNNLTNTGLSGYSTIGQTDTQGLSSLLGTGASGYGTINNSNNQSLSSLLNAATGGYQNVAGTAGNLYSNSLGANTSGLSNLLNSYSGGYGNILGSTGSTYANLVNPSSNAFLTMLNGAGGAYSGGSNLGNASLQTLGTSGMAPYNQYTGNLGNVGNALNQAQAGFTNAYAPAQSLLGGYTSLLGNASYAGPAYIQAQQNAFNQGQTTGGQLGGGLSGLLGGVNWGNLFSGGGGGQPSGWQQAAGGPLSSLAMSSF